MNRIWYLIDLDSLISRCIPMLRAQAERRAAAQLRSVARRRV